MLEFDNATQKELMETKMLPTLKDLGLKSTNFIINLGLMAQIIALFLIISVVVIPILAIFAKS